MHRAEIALLIMVVGIVAIALSQTPIDVATGLPSNAIYHYQTLIGGVLAITGAGIGAFLLRKQIQQTAAIERDRRRSRREAARAMLPFAISRLLAYAVDSGTYIRLILEGTSAEAMHAVPLPVVPADAVASLKEMIELSSPAEARVLGQIPILMQYQYARLTDTARSVAGGHINVADINLPIYALDAAKLYSRAEALFAFARGESDTITRSATYKRARFGLIMMGFDEISHAGTFTALINAAGGGGNLSGVIKDMGEANAMGIPGAYMM